MDGAPVSLFKEADHVRAAHALLWITSDDVLFDLNCFTHVTLHYETLMKTELAMGGQAWEATQRHLQVSSGCRTYPLWEVYDSVAEWDFVETLSYSLFGDERSVLPLPQGPSEEHQLAAYLLYARAMSACYLLCIVPQRWYPFKAYDCLRSQTSRDHLQAVDGCTLDPYSSDLRDVYAGSLDSPMCRAELSMVLQEVVPNIANPLERSNGENLRRSMCRFFTHAETGMDLNAYFCARRYVAAEKGVQTSVDACRMRDERVALRKERFKVAKRARQAHRASTKAS